MSEAAEPGSRPSPAPRPLRALVNEWVFDKQVPAGVGFLRALGTALLVLLLVQGVTGILLALCYVPSPDHAYDSIRYLDEDLHAQLGSRTFAVGRMLRGTHHWGSSAIVVLAFLHLMRVYFTGAYKRPRGLIWVLGVAIFGVLLGFGFTGYLLPWDMKAFWATDVGLNIVARTPRIGPALADLLRGGPELGAPTLTRMFALHVLALPALLLPLAGLHLLLVHKLGITPPGARVGEREEKPAPAVRVAGDAAAASGASAASAGTSARWQPFFPDHLFRELLVAAIALMVVIGLAVWLGPPLEAPADRDAKGYDPRPEWYFLGLFQLLNVPWFRGDAVAIATVGIPGGLALLALLLPWIDRNPERAPSRRPVAIAAGTILLATLVGLTAYAAWNLPKSHRPPPPRVPAGDGEWIPPSSPPFPPPTDPTTPADAAAGAPAAGDAALLAEGEKLMRSYECTTCHTFRGEGDDAGAGAPELVGAAKGHDLAWVELYLLDPKRMKPDVDMPSAKDLDMSDADRRKLAEWLRAIAGD